MRMVTYPPRDYFRQWDRDGQSGISLRGSKKKFKCKDKVNDHLKTLQEIMEHLRGQGNLIFSIFFS
jgi:hypothetical protein